MYRLTRALKLTDDPDAAKELPEVMRKFNEARELARKQEEQDSRYRLVEASPAGAGKR
jgi:hypothetical protein